MSDRTRLVRLLVAGVAGLSVSLVALGQPSGKGGGGSDGGGSKAPAKSPGNAPAKGPGRPERPADAPMPAAGAPGADDLKKMEEAMEAAAKPGPMHDWLKSLEGTWQTEIKASWPGAPEEVQLGVCKRRMELGGRFLMTEYDGRWEGKFFRGSGSLGYNNITKRFEQTWMDTMSTGTMMTTGTADPAGKVLTLTGEFTMGEGMNVKSRQVYTIVSPDKHTEAFYHAMGGQEMKVMEITYTRGSGGGAGDGAKGGGKGGSSSKGAGGSGDGAGKGGSGKGEGGSKSGGGSKGG